MKIWKLLGIITGLFLITLIARKSTEKPDYLKDQDKRYTVDDFLGEQDL